MTTERAVVFKCREDSLIGILHPATTHDHCVGILIVVGGPQYRVGSHRQFVQMARGWAAQGWPVFRFDYRGMGDSDGIPRSFDAVDDDIRVAIDAFLSEVPSLSAVIIFGLCDAASAALLYCLTDSRVRGLILANPWVRTPEGEARSFVRHYYGARLLQGTFWQKVLSGAFRPMEALRGFLNFWSLSRSRSHKSGHERFIDRMLAGLSTFSGSILILISEYDLTAREFTDLCSDNPEWAAASARSGITHRLLRGADHTFAVRASLDEALQVSSEWLADLQRLGE